LRAAREAWRAQHAVSLAPEWTAPRDERGWRFVGQGWRTAGEELLVETAARGRLLAMAEAREQRRVERRSLAWVA